MRALRPKAIGAGLVAAVVAMACSSGSSSSPLLTSAAVTTAVPSTTAPTTTTVAPTTASSVPATTLPAPDGDAFYTPPSPLPPGQPGDIIWARPFAVSGGGQGYLVLYRSTSVAGDPIAVSGVVIVPGAGAPAAPPEGRTVLAWAHGTTGLGDACAPSKQYPPGKAAELAIGMLAVSRGYVYVATDYEGLGPPGGHPYVVGQSEGRSVLDSVRAAERLSGSGATATSKVIVWGHSQGGGAAAFAAELQPTYSPELNIVGAIAGAPATELPTIAQSQDGGPYFGFVLMAASGFKVAYPNLSYDAVLNPQGIQAVESIGDECADAIIPKYAGQHASTYETASPQDAPGWKEAFAANEAGQRKTGVPIFIYQGDADEIIPVGVSKTLLDDYCAIGDVAYRKTYPGATHTSVIGAALGDIQAYAADRLAGKPAPSSCGTTPPTT